MNAPSSTAAEALGFRQYICHVCGLIYDEARGDADSGLAAGTRFEDIPDDWACPICGVGKADFVPYVPEPAVARGRPAPAALRRHGGRHDAGVVIVGAGRAGWQVAQALRERDATLPITVLSACSGDVYDKPTLSVAVARGLAPDGLVRESAAAAAARLRVQLRCDTHAVAIEPAARRLRTTRGTLRYRHLVLAHGAEPVLPAVLPPQRVWRVNDLAAYRKLRAALAGGPQRLAIVGAGLVGCELANDLALEGHDIVLLDTQPGPLAVQLPPAAGQRLLQAWAGLPVRFWGGVQVTGVDPAPCGGATPPARQREGSDAVPPARWRVRLADGRHADVDQVIAATGLRAAGRLAQSAGLAYDRTAGGIVADGQTGATSVAGVYALGDCAVVGGRASRYIEPIARQARGIADAIAGTPAAPAGQGIAAASRSAAEVLRVKTSALPITVTGSLVGPGTWCTDRDDAAELRMRRIGADGELLATLVARPPMQRPSAG